MRRKSIQRLFKTAGRADRQKETNKRIFATFRHERPKKKLQIPVFKRLKEQEATEGSLFCFISISCCSFSLILLLMTELSK
jgi:hypothetical protein